MPPRRHQLPEVERVVLGNGLRVVAVPDGSAPLVGVAVVYDVGFRSEPETRTGFAHLFEHMMFQGSANVAKVEHMRLVESAGGLMNGHTLADLTAYYEALPAPALDLALFLEADRMGSLAVSEENLRNQVDVVKEEIRVNVLNRPYGGFPWIPLPALAFDTYPNAHNGYGDFSHLEQASVADAEDFYATYYSPSNAVLLVAGDCRPEDVVALAERHFGPIPGRPAPTHGPWAEPPPAAERRRALEDPLAPQPAFAVGYRCPDPVADLDRYLAGSLLATLLAGGEASRLRSRLVHRDHSVTDVACGLGTFGEDTLFVRDPVLFQIIVHHPGAVSTDALLATIDEELAGIAEAGPSPTELARLVATSSAELWRSLDSLLDRAHVLASVEAVHGRAELVGQLADRLEGVGAAELATAAGELLDQHRSVVELLPKAAG